LKFKILIRIPVVQASSNLSIDEILREHSRIIAEEFKHARLEEAIERTRTSVLKARVGRVELESKLSTAQGKPQA
jgi:hypothetical protein